jgi:septum formation inhibitor MinC
MLTTAANNALTLNVTVPDGVEATARDGNLTLTGRVSYGAERAAAEDGGRTGRHPQRQGRH